MNENVWGFPIAFSRDCVAKKVVVHVTANNTPTDLAAPTNLVRKESIK